MSFYCSRTEFRSSVQSLSRVWLFATPWIAAFQASLSITNSWSSPKLISIESVMPSNHLILCHPLLLQLSLFPNIRVFSNESVLRIRWPKHWTFNFSISPSKEHPGLISFRIFVYVNPNLPIHLSLPYPFCCPHTWFSMSVSLFIACNLVNLHNFIDSIYMQ